MAIQRWAVSTRFQQVDNQKERFFSGTAPSELETKGWTTHEWLRFLRGLPDTTTVAQMKALDQQFHFTDSGNSEILAQWLVTAIHVGYEPAYPAVETFLVRVGRRKFLTPLYRELVKTPEGKERARKIYAKARPNYHSVSVGTIDEIVGWGE